jgi:hypothetical protein
MTRTITHANETLPFRLIKVVEYVHIILTELDNLEVVDNPLLGN